MIGTAWAGTMGAAKHQDMPVLFYSTIFFGACKGKKQPFVKIFRTPEGLGARSRLPTRSVAGRVPLGRSNPKPRQRGPSRLPARSAAGRKRFAQQYVLPHGTQQPRWTPTLRFFWALAVKGAGWLIVVAVGGFLSWFFQHFQEIPHLFFPGFLELVWQKGYV